MIIVFGSINLDQIGNLPCLPKPSETVAGSSFATSPGLEPGYNRPYAMLKASSARSA
jgi:ribokinase